MTDKTMLLMSGSLRNGSSNTAAINTAATLLPPRWNPSIYRGMGGLPHFDPDVEAEALPASVAELRGAIAACDAVLICTPEYAAALPGSFKNVLDWTVGGMEIVGKPVAWLNVSSSPTKANGAHSSLRAVLSYTGADVVDEACVAIPVSRGEVDGGRVTGQQFCDGATSALRALTRYVDATPTLP